MNKKLYVDATHTYFYTIQIYNTAAVLKQGDTCYNTPPSDGMRRKGAYSAE
jgi:hypothetical protein